MNENLASPLALSDGNRRVFRAVVEALVLAMLSFRHDLAPGGSVGAEFVGDHALGRTTLLAQKPLQQPLGGSSMTRYLDDFVKHISFLIDRRQR
jgi:hypothetical protein